MAYLAAGAEKVPLKQHSSEVLQAALAADIPTHIASVNWSADLIWGALQNTSHAERLVVHSNTLEVMSGTTTGRIEKCESLASIWLTNTNSALSNQVNLRRAERSSAIRLLS